MLKREEIDRYHYYDLADVRSTLFGYIEAYYNRSRIHARIGMPPDEFPICAQEIGAPSAEFAGASDATSSQKEKAGDEPRPRSNAASPAYPLAGCSPASPTSVFADTIAGYENMLAVERMNN